jgi:transcriptional regulator with XRE-family HTH domain
MPQPTLGRSHGDLSDFLTSRRARLSPADVGLPDGARRRTKGLRREEVASLAGVGLTWYTWFEQGRDIRVSPDFLENVAKALRLTRIEREHLYVLTGRVGAPDPIPERKVSPALRRVLTGLGRMPAYIRTARWDPIAWNAAADRLFGFSERKPEERNFLRLAFTDAAFRARMSNWAKDAQALVAKFRGNYAKYRGDGPMDRLVQEMIQRSPEFRQLWRRHEVMSSGQGIKVIRIKGKGDMVFEHTSFAVNGEPDLDLVIYAPVGKRK